MSYLYQRQWNNRLDPSSSCVLTCLAMALSTPNEPINADELWLAAKQRKWDRLSPETVDNLSLLYKKPYRIRKDLKFSDLVPGTILYGGWTAGGHCVLIVEKKDLTLVYHDPLGVFENGKYNFDLLGERQNVNSNESSKYIGKDGEIWGHLPIWNR